MSEGYPDPVRRFLIMVPSMLAAIMVTVDVTIANVALPHMQSSLSASQDQVLWVLTSYLVAGAIATPLSGWLASRFGRKMVMTFSVAGFTLASALCGAANDLATIVLARLLQGACGAALIPLSQAILLDINPPENYAKAMGIFGAAAMAGPVIGPTLGGWLTDSLSWRWVFFVNVPFGILSFLGILAFVPGGREQRPLRFDLFGFMTVSIALAAFQLMIDRGERLDWFDSPEVRIYAAILGLAVYLGVVHVFTARDTFVRPELFKDRNFAVGCVFSILIGISTFATMPLIVLMTQNLIGYTAFRTGLVGLPRALAALIAIIAVARVANRVDPRLILASGLAIVSVGLLMHARLDLYTDQWSLILAGIVLGIGGSLTFVPLSVIVFTTLPRVFRNEGAAMYALTRNLGNAIGISLLQRELIHFTAGSRAHLVEGIRPDNPMLQYGRPDFDFESAGTIAQINADISRQASMVGNVEVYYLVFFVALAMLPLVLLMRTSARRASQAPLPIME